MLRGIVALRCSRRGLIEVCVLAEDLKRPGFLMRAGHARRNDRKDRIEESVVS
jgi:hypothetical protein